MQKLLDIINKLAEKYKFEESEIKEVQQAVFSLENGEDSLLNEEEDFKSPDEPREEHQMEETYGDDD
jgi:hypothetical protein